MPHDRLLHPRQGFSAKLANLSHLAYRVWTQYLLSADDYGVMPYSAAIIRGANLALAQESEEEVFQALDDIIEVDLVLTFDHQGQKYVCSAEWQDFQKVSYPRATFYPSPSPEVVEALSDSTRALFQKKLQNISKSSKPNTTGRSRKHTANGIRLTANGSTSGSDGFAAFWMAYPRKTAKGEAGKAWRKLAPDAALQATILVALGAQTRSEQWSKGVIPHAATWLNQRRWDDELPMALRPTADGASAGPSQAELDEAFLREGERRARIKAFQEGRL